MKAKWYLRSQAVEMLYCRNRTIEPKSCHFIHVWLLSWSRKMRMWKLSIIKHTDSRVVWSEFLHQHNERHNYNAREMNFFLDSHCVIESIITTNNCSLYLNPSNIYVGFYICSSAALKDDDFKELSGASVFVCEMWCWIQLVIDF